MSFLSFTYSAQLCHAGIKKYLKIIFGTKNWMSIFHHVQIDASIATPNSTASNLVWTWMPSNSLEKITQEISFIAVSLIYDWKVIAQLHYLFSILCLNGKNIHKKKLQKRFKKSRHVGMFQTEFEMKFGLSHLNGWIMNFDISASAVRTWK